MIREGNRNDDFIVYDNLMCGLLLLLRRRLVNTKPNNQNPKKLVFFFDDSDLKMKKVFEVCKKNKNKISEYIENLIEEEVGKELLEDIKRVN